MRTILHPTDFTACSERLFLLICPIARHHSAEILVLHVISPAICPPEDRIADDVKRDSFLYQSCWGRFAQLRPLANDVPLRFLLKVGQPVETIADVARREDCQLIAMSSSRHSYLHYTLRENFAEGLARTCPVPVLCLKAPITAVAPQGNPPPQTAP